MANDGIDQPRNWPQPEDVHDPAASIAALARLIPKLLAVQVSQLPTLALLAGDNHAALESLLPIAERFDKALQQMMELNKTFVPETETVTSDE